MNVGTTKTTQQRLKEIFTRKRIIIASTLILALLIVIPAATYAHFARDISDPERLMNRNNRGIVLKDKNNEVIYTYGRVNDNNNLKLSAISDEMEHALVASEDHDFYKHEGYSIKGIAAAMFANVTSKDATRYGGSTLTQQLVKNKLFSSNKSFLRKYQEISMAVAVERRYTKDEILEMYLNSVYFGEGAFGVNDAAKTYFNKSAKDLNTEESAMLVGLLPAPSIYSPISGDKILAKHQQDNVLRKMVENGYINESAKAKAEHATLTYAPPKTANFASAQHYTMMVLDELKHKYGEERIIRDGFVVKTGLDLKWQKQAEDVVKKDVQKFQAAGGRNAGLVAIDPKNGEVRALVGSVDWNNQSFGKVNMALALRQPGSSFKPIYYSQALDQHVITAATVLHDQPTDFGGWKPENYDFKYRGDIPVRNALAQSLNIPAAEVMQKLGTHTASLAAQRIGVTSVDKPDTYGLTLALGTAETRLYDMTNAYAALANKGEQHKPKLITEVKDKYDNEIFTQGPEQTNQARSQEAAFITSSILSDDAARAPTFGSSLNIPNHQVAVKTGTTNDNKDAWTIGYTPAVSVGVWVGNNENQPMHGLAGGSSAGQIWKETISGYLQDVPNEKFEAPAGVVQVNVCKGSGLRAEQTGGNTYSEYFIRGTEPTTPCNTPQPEQPKQEKPKKLEVQQAVAPVPEDKHENENNGRGNNREVGGRGAEEAEKPKEDNNPKPQDQTDQAPSPTPQDTQPNNSPNRQSSD
jgi:1A family penicillin-binding protein